MLGYVPLGTGTDAVPLRETLRTSEAVAAEAKAEREELAAKRDAAAPAQRDYRSAALLALRVYPGPVGHLIRRELADWCDFGYRIGANPNVQGLHDQVMADARKAGLT